MATQDRARAAAPPRASTKQPVAERPRGDGRPGRGRVYGHPKWGAGVGDISVVTQIGEKGATYVADGRVLHDAATTWWIVYPN